MQIEKLLTLGASPRGPDIERILKRQDAATAIEGQLVYSAVKSMWGW